MVPNGYLPLYRLTRGGTVESVHFGAIAVVGRGGERHASHGDPDTVTYLRSTAKPFQALPLVQAGGVEALSLTPPEVALICGSHAGTDRHVEVARSIQSKVRVTEGDLLCGVHSPYDRETARALRSRGEDPTPNRHNCSGKHSGMLAYARLRGWPTEGYIDPGHPVQKDILATFAEMCNLKSEAVRVGTDGCSAPNFAVPLYNAALAYARLSDPSDLSPDRAEACQTITAAMIAHPEMVSGAGRFDTWLMEIGRGAILAKGGAEGYQGVGLLPGALGPGSPALGVAVKISDGDSAGRARAAVVVEILRQLGALDETQLDELAPFGPTRQVQNWRKLEVGLGEPCFQLQFP
jgi:L-asparaginase II